MEFKYEKVDDKTREVKDLIIVESPLELIKCIFLMNKDEIIKELKANNKPS